MEDIKNYFGVGKIYTQGPSLIQYHVDSKKDLESIIKHFYGYPLLTQQQADYLLFKQAFNVILSGEHRTMDGMSKILGIKASINLGLSDKLKVSFPNIVPVKRPSGWDRSVKDFSWVSGFASADGCFFIGLHKSPGHKMKERVKLMFKFTQYTRDEQLMLDLVNSLGCGSIYKHRDTFDLKVTKILDIENKIIPLFHKYPILGVKSQDFADFCLVFKLIKSEAHLTKEGLEKIRQIKMGTNLKRVPGEASLSIYNLLYLGGWISWRVIYL